MVDGNYLGSGGWTGDVCLPINDRLLRLASTSRISVQPIFRNAIFAKRIQRDSSTVALAIARAGSKLWWRHSLIGIGSSLAEKKDIL